jgi:hypothetical protein
MSGMPFPNLKLTYIHRGTLGAAPEDGTSPVMRGNLEGGPGILTEGFDGRLDDGDELAAVMKWRRQTLLGTKCSEQGGAKLEAQ